MRYSTQACPLVKSLNKSSALVASFLLFGFVISFQHTLVRYKVYRNDFSWWLPITDGPAISGAHNTIVTARAGKDLVSSLTSELLTIGPRFGGDLDEAASILSTDACFWRSLVLMSNSLWRICESKTSSSWALVVVSNPRQACGNHQAICSLTLFQQCSPQVCSCCRASEMWMVALQYVLSTWCKAVEPSAIWKQTS